MTDCVFCNIVQGQARNEEVVFENDDCIVLLDKYRKTSAGAICLVVTKKHIVDLTMLDDSVSKTLMTTIKQATILSKTSFKARGIRVWQANGKAAGQSIDHLHFHIVPCNSFWDRIMASFPGAFDIFLRNNQIVHLKLKTLADNLRKNYKHL